MYLPFDTLIEINNIIAISNDNTLRNVNIKPYRFDKKYIKI